MTIQEFVQRLRRRLGDTQTDGKFQTTTLEEFGSEAQRDIARRLDPWLLPELAVIDTGSLTQDGSYCYFAVTGDVARISCVSVYNATNQDVEVTMVTDAGAYKQMRSKNIFFHPDDKQYFGWLEYGRLYIEPDRSGDNFKLRYVKAPSDLTGTTEMDLDDRWEDLCLDYGEYLARKMEQRDAEAEAALQKYEMKLQAANGGAP